jgi:hypothetical protein
MFRRTLMAITAVSLLTTTAPAFSAGVGMARPIRNNYARTYQPADQRVLGLRSTTGVRSGDCTGAACNGGNAGILFGRGGDGAAIGKPRYDDMKLKTGMGRQGPASTVRGGGFFQVRNEGG